MHASAHKTSAYSHRKGLAAHFIMMIAHLNGPWIVHCRYNVLITGGLMLNHFRDRTMHCFTLYVVQRVCTHSAKPNDRQRLCLLGVLN